MEAAASGDSPVSSAKLTELGKALDQTTISGPGAASPAAAHEDLGDGSGTQTTPQHDGGDGEDDDDAEDFEDDEDEEDYDDLSGDDVDHLPATSLPTKSPKKRGRTDSMKKALPPPASQRYKHLGDAAGANFSSGGISSPEATTSTASSSSTTSAGMAVSATAPMSAQSKLMVKDRKGSGMGIPNAHSIMTAVKQAPPAKEKSNPRRWSKHEDESLRLAVERSGERNWKAIADQVPGRNHTQCLQRWTKVLKPGLIKGHWTPEEDAKLRDLVAEGKKNWGQVASLIPGRTSKQCRERWCNHLDPNINKGTYTEDEDKIIIEMQAKLGNRWSIIAQQLKGRTEDAVKIRWKSLMRGRRAALKEDKSGALSVAAGSSPSGSSASSPSEHARPKAPKSTPTRPKPKPATAAVKAELEPVKEESTSEVPSFDAEPPQDITGATISESEIPDYGKTVPPQALVQPELVGVGLNPGAPMQNVNDMVAASIHNFRMSQQFHPGVVQANGGIYANNPAMMAQANASGFAMANGAYSMGLPQQPSYQLPPGYPIPNDPTMVQGYVVPANYAVSGPMQVPMQPSSGPIPPGVSYSSQSMAMGMMDVHGAPIPMAVQNGQGMVHQGIVGGGMAIHNPVPVSGSLHGRATSMTDMGLPPASAASAGKVLNTPREEWGSSQTPRSHMILTEGHASAYELFHQQRLRLMMKEREKQGLSFVSAPSPGQALLTKELEANKERQAIMQKGWKSAVDAMISVNSATDLAALDEQQRFDSLLEKVTLSALDPTDEELLDQTVDIIAGDDTIDL